MVSTDVRAVARLAVVTGALAALLLALALTQHGSQAAFQVVRPASQYAELLLQRASALRLEMWVDNLFLCLYAALFLLLERALTSTAPNSSAEVGRAARIAGWALGLTALLDAAENAHILSMLAQAEAGLIPSQVGIDYQAAESQVKFLLSYVGLVALSFALTADTWAERALSFVLRWVQAPIGVAVFVTPQPALTWLYLMRASFFVLGLWWLAYVLLARLKAQSPAQAALQA